MPANEIIEYTCKTCMICIMTALNTKGFVIFHPTQSSALVMCTYLAYKLASLVPRPSPPVFDCLPYVDSVHTRGKAMPNHNHIDLSPAS